MLQYSVQFSSVFSSVRLYDPMNCSTSGLPVHHQLPEPTQTHVHWVSDAIQLSHPLSSPSPPALNLPQHQGLFKWVSSSHEVAKYWSFRFNISPSNEHPGLISFRMDWLDLLAVLQHHSSKASILRCSAFFIVQLSHPYMTTGKVTILLLFYVWSFWPQGIWDLSSPTRDPICTPGIGRWSLNHWTAREVPSSPFLTRQLPRQRSVIRNGNSSPSYSLLAFFPCKCENK